MFKYVLLVLSGISIADSRNSVVLPLVKQFKIMPSDTIFHGRKMHSYLALGDSYTIAEAVPASESFPMQTAALLEQAGVSMDKPKVIATTGWTTADLKRAIAREKITDTFSVVSLLIGVNNQYQGLSSAAYQTEFRQLLQDAIQFAAGHPEHVIVISIPDYSITPFAQQLHSKTIAQEIDLFNEINKKIALVAGAQYLDITTESRQANASAGLLAADGLHYSGKEYHIWAQMLAPLMQKLLQ
jgi:lysophospholipase L1-like esterase